MRTRSLLAYFLVVCSPWLVVGAAGVSAADASRPDVERAVFGQTPDGREVEVFTLRNSHGLEARVIEYGAMLISLRAPDREGRFEDIALGFDTLEEYLNRNFGGTTGRYANRIGGARFVLDGVEHRVTANAGANHIHGGRRNFSNVVWDGEEFADGRRAGVRLRYVSPDGEEGFPGRLACTVTYTLSEDDELAIEYDATTDKPTVVNLTNHGYYNLAGAGSGDVGGHILWIDAARYTVPDAALVPTGEIAAVAGTPLDFTTPRAIGERIDELTGTRGYDHNYVFDDWDGSLAVRVRVWEPKSGRMMEVRTSEPGMQLYTANHVRDLEGRGGKVYQRHGAFCLETQHFPDSPNQPNFPSTVLRPGERFHSATVHRLSVRRENPFDGAAAVKGENWPCWRGPTRQGISRETGLPVKWSRESNVGWKVEIPGDGWSSPIVWRDRIFVTTATDEGRSYRLLSLDRQTGETLWDRQIVRQKADHKQPNNSFATSTPATDGRYVYCAAADGTIAAVDFDGNVAWTHKEFEFYSEHGLGSSPVLAEGLVILALDWSSAGPDKKVGWQIPWDESLVLAVDATTGDVRWRGDRGLSRIAHVTPQVVEVDGSEQLVSGAGDVIQGFDLRSGERLWTVRTSGEGVVPSIVAGDGLVFATTGFGESRTVAVRPGGRGDVTDSRVAWRSEEDVPKVPSMLYVEPYLYAVSDTGILNCLRAQTGENVYRERLRGRFWPSPVWADGRIYVLSDKGETTVIKDGPAFEILAENDLDEKCLASPAISHGCIFIRTERHLYCIGD